MTATSFAAALREARLLPVLTVDALDGVAELGTAIAAAGVRVLEVTLRTAAGISALEVLSATPGLMVGAGTVLAPDVVDLVADVGADFVVCPGFDPDVVARASVRGIPILPGVATATEVQQARRAGVELHKFFPAGLAGGTAMLHAFSGPFRDSVFVPSGGVDAGNAREYLALSNVSAVSGSWMFPRAALQAGGWGVVHETCRAAVSLVTDDAP